MPVHGASSHSEYADLPDLLGGISKGGRHSALYTFLCSAFLPATSENQNEDRFDVLSAHLQIPTSTKKSPLKLLDVGCGQSLLLRKLLTDHSSSTHHLAHLQGNSKLKYVGIDRGAPAEHDWEGLEARCSKRPCCFRKPVHHVLDIHQVNTLSAVLKRDGPFDFIVLANVLHELRLPAIPEILYTLYRSLRHGGKLVIIDPDAEWCLSPPAWKMDEKTTLPLIEWEADAVWFAEEPIVAALKAVGFRTAATLAHRTTQFWAVSGTKDNHGPSIRETKANVAEVLREYLNKQTEAELQRYRRLRQEVQTALRTHNAVQGELRRSVMEFLGCCASNSRRLEAINALEGKGPPRTLPQ